MRGGRTFRLGLAVLLLACARLGAIPMEENAGTQAHSATNTPEDAESAVTNLTGVFDAGQVENQATETWQRIHQQAPAAGAHPFGGTNHQPFKVIGGYSERFNNMDVDAIASDAVSNEAFLQQQASRIPINPEVIQRDLNATPTNYDDEEKRMRELIKSVAAKPSGASEAEIKGLRIAITYLVMAGLIILIIFARR